MDRAEKIVEGEILSMLRAGSTLFDVRRATQNIIQRLSRLPAEERARAVVKEWDEYGQGYDERGRLVFCICGCPMPLEFEHHCIYNEPQPEGEPE